MPPARAPSFDLLWALHRVTQSSSRQKLPLLCSARPTPEFYSARALTTTTSLRDNDQSRPKPSTYPPSTSSSPSGATPSNKINPFAPKSHERGPASEEDTQTDFGMMDIYANMPTPATSIDACVSDGFHLDNGAKITGYAGLLVAGGEAWSWKPWMALQSSSSSSSTTTTTTTTTTTDPKISDLLDARRGILTIPKQSLGIFSLLYPKPDLLIFGTGSRLWMLSPETKTYLMEELGLRVDVMDTANASAAYNLLAKERGVEGGASVGGAFLPVGWKGPEATRKRR